MQFVKGWGMWVGGGVGDVVERGGGGFRVVTHVGKYDIFYFIFYNVLHR